MNNCATWSGTLAGPLAPSASAPWKYEWRLTATGEVRNPTGPTAAPVTRTMTAVVPVVIPTASPASGTGPLNFLYSGSDMWFQNSVHVKAPVYVTRDLHLESTAVIDGEAQKAAIGRDLYLKNPQNQIGLTGGSDPRIAEIHVVNKCSSKDTPALHTCGPSDAQWDTDTMFATPRQRHTAGPAAVYLLHPEAHLLRFFAIRTRQVDRSRRPGPLTGPPDNPSNMGYWYQNADLGPSRPARRPQVRRRSSIRRAESPDNSINWSATPTTAINLTPGASYTCKSMAGSTILGELPRKTPRNC